MCLEETHVGYQKSSKAKELKKVINLVSLSTNDAQNLSCTLPSKEILNLDLHKISFIVVLIDFIKAQKLRGVNSTPWLIKNLVIFGQNRASVKEDHLRIA